MKAYLFYFMLPDQMMIFVTGKPNGTSFDRADAAHFETSDPESLKAYIQTTHKDLEIWKGAPHKSITFHCEEVLSTGMG